MTNQERQIKLDDEKWYASQKVGYDLAGAMDWCGYCKYQKEACESKSGKECTFDKPKGFPCAQAYKEMVCIKEPKTTTTTSKSKNSRKKK